MKRLLISVLISLVIAGCGSRPPSIPTTDRCLALHTMGLPECRPPTSLPAAAPTTAATSHPPMATAAPIASCASPSPGTTWTRPTDGAVMVYVPRDEFQMGILDAFWIDATEVTNAQFAAFLNEQANQTEDGMTWLELDDTNCLIELASGEYRPRGGYDNHPVVGVSWYAAVTYCEWAGARLPTKAEWEYSVHGAQGPAYPWGDEFELHLRDSISGFRCAMSSTSSP
jgi:formylglycine-generating enzyme required for sulfatase activity